MVECLRQLGETLEPTNSKHKKWKNQEDSLKNEESIAESGRIFLRNLSYTTQEADIEQLFGTYGKKLSLNIKKKYPNYFLQDPLAK